MFDIIAIAAS